LNFILKQGRFPDDERNSHFTTYVARQLKSVEMVNLQALEIMEQFELVALADYSIFPGTAGAGKAAFEHLTIGD
jgi:hypothetical protein